MRVYAGLGHRISTASFRLCTALAKHRVLQVACGQQHNIARVLEATSSALGENGAAVLYVWGSHSLGQLGTGRLGATRGKLLPTRLHLDPSEYRDAVVTSSDESEASSVAAAALDVVDVACGANHSVAVLSTGQVLGFGHSEYNQQGGKG